MKLETRPLRNVPLGFSVVEVMIGLVLSSILFSVTYMVLFSGIHNTIQGQDAMDSTRAAAGLFQKMRKDMLACEKLDTQEAAVLLQAGQSYDENSLAYSSQVLFDFPPESQIETVTYALQAGENGNPGHVVRTERWHDGSEHVENIGIPRIQAFQVSQVWRRQAIVPGQLSNFLSGLLFVRIIVSSDDERLSSRTLNLSSFFVFTQMTPTNWNYFLTQ